MGWVRKTQGDDTGPMDSTCAVHKGLNGGEEGNFFGSFYVPLAGTRELAAVICDDQPPTLGWASYPIAEAMGYIRKPKGGKGYPHLISIPFLRLVEVPH